MISILVFLLVFGALILVHEFGHFIVAKKHGVRVERFSLGFGPVLFKKKKGETEYTLSGVPLGGYVKLSGDTREEFKGTPREYFSKTPGQRAQIIFFGPLLNYLLGFLCFWLIFFVGYPGLTTKVGGLLDGYGAQRAGLIAGDRIISLDGKKLGSWDDLQMAIYNRQSRLPARLEVLRNGEVLDMEVELQPKEMDDELGKKRSVGLLGITPDLNETVKLRYGFLESLSLGAQKTWNLTALTLKAIWRLVTGNMSLRDSVTGPIGIFYVTSKAANLGFLSVLNLVGLLSVSLAIFNLLPLPVLDGGHLLLLGIEKIRGRNLSAKVERFVTQAGFTLIITLAVVVTYNDLLRFKDQIFRFFQR